MNQPTPEDIAAMRADGSLRDYFRFLADQAVKPEPAAKPALAAVPDLGYHIARPGAWPCGTGPNPTHCANCTPASSPATRAEHREDAA